MTEPSFPSSTLSENQAIIVFPIPIQVLDSAWVCRAMFPAPLSPARCRFGDIPVAIYILGRKGRAWRRLSDAGAEEEEEEEAARLTLNFGRDKNDGGSCNVPFRLVGGGLQPAAEISKNLLLIPHVIPPGRQILRICLSLQEAGRRGPATNPSQRNYCHGREGE